MTSVFISKQDFSKSLDTTRRIKSLTKNFNAEKQKLAKRVEHFRIL